MAMVDPPEHSRGAIGFVFGAFQAAALPGPILVEVMAAIGFPEPTTRQLLARMLRQGQLTRRRIGRVSVYRLAGDYLERWSRLRYGDDPPAWTGAFHVVVHDIPERQRGRRERLLAAAVRAGFGQARPGLLVGLAPPGFLQQWATDLGQRGPTKGGSEPMVETGLLSVDLDAARRIASTAWSLPNRAVDLQAAAADLERLIDRIDDASSTSGSAALRLMFDAGMIAGSPRYSVPALPADLQPTGWPAPRVQQLLHTAIERLIPAVGDDLYRRLTASPHAHLIQGGWWPAIPAQPRPDRPPG